MPGIRICGVIGVTFATLILAQASHAAGTAEQRRACRDDAFKYCHDAIPDVPRITACMKKNFKKLSPLCRKQFK